jgi:NAD(P)-dependent dehydrogenase (short-subunit alcohol dehydrogenase family)
MSDAGAVAIVTGASRGIGRAAALSLSARGVALVLLGRPSAELDQARRACLDAGAPRAHTVHADLSDLQAVDRAAVEALAGHGAPQIVVHNAGEVHRAAVEQLSLADWQHEISLNLSAPFALTRALLPAMRRQGRGRILFVASISSTLGTAGQSAYCASKWGVLGFMKSLAAELSDSGLMTCALLPGSVSTRMLEGSGFPARMSPEDVARTLTFLALDAPLSHNGAVVEQFGV